MDVDKKFPEGMRVLAVDDDCICLNIIAMLLQICKYDVTAVFKAEDALDLLRARNGADQFDLVVTDVHMPGMDGFKLLEHVSSEINIPVIMLSANDEMETKIKGIKHGASDYLVKPIHLEQVKSFWIHVVKKGMKSGNGDAGQKLQQPGDVDVDQNGCAKKTRKYTRKKKNDGHETEVDNIANTSTQRRKRIQWSGELHSRFVEVVNRIGIDRAVPKKILQMMGVPGLGRENVASHLQKYRIYLKQVSLGTIKLSDPFANAHGWNKWDSISLNNKPESWTRKPELGAYQAPRAFLNSPSSSSNPFARINSTSAFETHNSLLPTQSVQLTDAQRNLVIPGNNMGPVGQGGSLLKYAATAGSQRDASQIITFGSSHINMSGGSKMFHFGAFSSSIVNSSDGIGFINTSKASRSGSSGNLSANVSKGSCPSEVINTSKSSPSGSSGSLSANVPKGSQQEVKSTGLSSYSCVLRRKILGANKGIPVDDDEEFQSIADDDEAAPKTHLATQSTELANQHSVQMMPSSADLSNKIATAPSRFANLSISTNNGITAVPSNFDDFGHQDGTFEGPSQGTQDLTVDQFLELTPPSYEMLNSGNQFQNYMDTAMREPVVGFSYQQMVPPVNLGSGTNPIVMTNGNYSLGGASNIIYTLPNGQGASGNLPMNDSTVALQALADELNNSNDPLMEEGEAHGISAEDLLAEYLVDDFNEDFFTNNNALMDADLLLDP